MKIFNSETSNPMLNDKLLDNLDLYALSKVAQQHNQWTFLMTINPLYVQGATGSPVNPIIIY